MDTPTPEEELSGLELFKKQHPTPEALARFVELGHALVTKGLAQFGAFRYTQIVQDYFRLYAHLTYIMQDRELTAEEVYPLWELIPEVNRLMGKYQMIIKGCPHKRA